MVYQYRSEVQFSPFFTFEGPLDVETPEGFFVRSEGLEVSKRILVAYSSRDVVLDRDAVSLDIYASVIEVKEIMRVSTEVNRLALGAKYAYEVRLDMKPNVKYILKTDAWRIDILEQSILLAVEHGISSPELLDPDEYMLFRARKVSRYHQLLDNLWNITFERGSLYTGLKARARLVLSNKRILLYRYNVIGSIRSRIDDRVAVRDRPVSTQFISIPLIALASARWKSEFFGALESVILHSARQAC